MTDLTEIAGRVEGLHTKLAAAHPSLSRGQVWCRSGNYILDKAGHGPA